MRLTDRQKSVIQLMNRSKADNEGWYSVGNGVWPIVHQVLPSDLAETEATASGGRFRFTVRGQAIADYI